MRFFAHLQVMMMPKNYMMTVLFVLLSLGGCASTVQEASIESTKSVDNPHHLLNPERIKKRRDDTQKSA